MLAVGGERLSVSGFAFMCAVGIAAGGEYMGMVGQPIERRRGHFFVGERGTAAGGLDSERDLQHLAGAFERSPVNLLESLEVREARFASGSFLERETAQIS